MENDRLNNDVAAIVFGVSRDLLDAWPWPKPDFAGDRRWSAAVVTHMLSKPDATRRVFERELESLAETFVARGSKGGLCELMVVNTPDELCKAAVTACLECGLEESTSTVGMDR